MKPCGIDTRSDKEPRGTRQRVLLAAGELFAERGFEATGIRDILEKAGAHSAAIHYHFQSKEKLYHEALRYVLQRFVTELPAESERPRSRAQVSRALAVAIRQSVRTYLSPAHPRWYGRLALRGLSADDPEVQGIVREVLRPEQEGLRRLIREGVPGTDERTVELHAFSITGQITFYGFARGPVLAALGEEDFSEEFLEEVAAHVTRVTLRGLGLPVPARV